MEERRWVMYCLLMYVLFWKCLLAIGMTSYPRPSKPKPSMNCIRVSGQAELLPMGSKERVVSNGCCQLAKCT